MQETSKALIRRLADSRYANRYFLGNGIDIGCGDDCIGKYWQQFPLMMEVRGWDLADGDAQLLATVPDNSYDFVHSSHCLEHMRDPYEAFTNWVRVCRPAGYMVITVPEEDMYEQGVWPSTYNGDHKTSWTIGKTESWSPVSINLMAFLFSYLDQVEVVKIEKVDATYQYEAPRMDQTAYGISECAIEFIVRKRTPEEIERQGRLFTK